jgi:type II secretion system protein H
VTLRGASLIEMMVVLGIVGILAAIAVPSFGPMIRGQRVTAAATLVAALLDEARQRAVAEGRCHRVIAPTTQRLRIERRTSADCASSVADASWTAMKEIVIDGFSVAVESAPVLDAGTELVFRPNSRLRGDGDLTVFADEIARVVLSVPSSPIRATITVIANGRVCAETFAADPPVLVTTATCP